MCKKYLMKDVKAVSKTALDMTGKKVGKLTVIKRAGVNKEGYVMWLCKCECGNTRLVCGRDLRSKKPTRSCGCLREKTPQERLEEPDKDIIYTELIRYAIVEQACKDYEWALRYLNRLDHPGLTLTLSQKEKVEKGRMFVDSCERFFRGAWFSRLVDLDGETLIETLRKRAVEEKRAITRHKI